MNIVFATLALNLCAIAPALAADTAIKPFHAEYATLRNGGELGRSTLDLSDNGDGSWTLRSERRRTARPTWQRAPGWKAHGSRVPKPAPSACRALSA